MPITIKRDDSLSNVPFGELKCGDCFMWDECTYIKIRIDSKNEEEDNYYTAIHIETGTEEHFDDYDNVKPVKATLTYSI